MITTEVSIINDKMQINISGEQNKTKVFVLTGLGSIAEEWYLLQNLLEDKFAVYVINRMGYGKSTYQEGKRTSMQIAKEIKSLYDNLQIKEKIILVGHSQGGFYAQHFAKFFPELVKSLVLVDSITGENDEFYRLNTPEWIGRASGMARVEMMRRLVETDREIHKRMLKPMLEFSYSKFPDEIKESILEFVSDKNFIKTVIKEFEARAENFEEFRKIKEFPQIPLKVLMRDPRIAIQMAFQYGVPEREATTVEELWLKHTYDLLALSSKSELIECDGADHNIHLSKPDCIAKAIESLA